MPRGRSVAVVALLWVAAFAGSSAPDGFGLPSQAGRPLIAALAAGPAQPAGTLDGLRRGKRWALFDDTGKRWA
ncbi:MAG TPA: hypothetical protein VF323_13950 [Candidatus Limnocylindrales bacterium]